VQPAMKNNAADRQRDLAQAREGYLAISSLDQGQFSTTKHTQKKGHQLPYMNAIFSEASALLKAVLRNTYSLLYSSFQIFVYQLLKKRDTVIRLYNTVLFTNVLISCLKICIFFFIKLSKLFH
jgi:hypothetical protein